LANSNPVVEHIYRAGVAYWQGFLLRQLFFALQQILRIDGGVSPGNAGSSFGPQLLAGRFINGGIVKLFLAAALWLCIGAKLFFLLKREPYWGQLYWACFLTILLNNTISNRYGFLYDKVFWLFCLLLCGEEKARVIRK